LNKGMHPKENHWRKTTAWKHINWWKTWHQ